MKITYNPYIPINKNYILCLMLVCIIFISMETYIFGETNIVLSLIAVILFIASWLFVSALQNKKMDIQKIILKHDQLVIYTSNKKYQYCLSDIKMKSLAYNLHKVISIDDTFLLNMGNIRTKSFYILEHKINNKNTNSRFAEYNILLIMLFVLFMIFVCIKLKIDFDAILYAAISFYLIYQIFINKR